jgi:hypothetical protein
MEIFIAVLFAMQNERFAEKMVLSFLAKTANAESTEDAGRRDDQFARMLDRHPTWIRPFCEKCLNEGHEQFEFGRALAVASLMETAHRAIADVAIRILKSDKTSVDFVSDAAHVLARHGRTVEADEFKKLLAELPHKPAVRVSCSLITQLPGFAENDRVEILRIALKMSDCDDLKDRGYVAGSVAVDKARVNEQVYLDGIKRFPEPHFRTILMIALLDFDLKKYGHLEKEIVRLSANDTISKWHYERYLKSVDSYKQIMESYKQSKKKDQD